MSLTKACPSCRRLYSDVSLNFCLEDGSVLSSSFEFPDFLVADSDVDTEIRAEPIEIETFVRPKAKAATRSKKKENVEVWEYKKSLRTASENPERSDSVTSDRPISKWTSSDYVRQITFEIAGKHTFHAQENLEILRTHLNKFIKHGKFKKTAWHLGTGRFTNSSGVFGYHFQKDANPTSTDFLLQLVKFFS